MQTLQREDSPHVQQSQAEPHDCQDSLLLGGTGTQKARPLCGKIKDGSNWSPATRNLYLRVIKYAFWKGSTPWFNQTWGSLSLPNTATVVYVVCVVLNLTQVC